MPRALVSMWSATVPAGTVNRAEDSRFPESQASRTPARGQFPEAPFTAPIWIAVGSSGGSH